MNSIESALSKKLNHNISKKIVDELYLNKHRCLLAKSLKEMDREYCTIYDGGCTFTILGRNGDYRLYSTNYLINRFTGEEVHRLIVDVYRGNRSPTPEEFSIENTKQ